MYINRLSSDGTIVDFRKDGSTLGSIQVAAGTIKINGPDGSGLYFGNSSIFNSGDATKSLGTSSQRFTDLHLSGTVNSATLLTANNNTDDTNKEGHFLARQYDSGTETEGFQILQYFSNSSENRVDLGGASSAYNAATSVSFYTAANTTTRTGTERVRIDSSGRVGIGTTSMGAPLHITNASPVIRLTDSDTSRFAQIAAFDGNLRFDADNNNQQSSTNISFRTDNTEKVRIDNNGAMLVGKTTDALSVAGTTLNSGGEAGKSQITRSSNAPLTLSRLINDGDILAIYSASTQVGSLGSSSSDFVLTSLESDKDILFKGIDGSSTITALTLDMSDAGFATFNDGVKGDYFKATGSIPSETSANTAYLDFASGNARIVTKGADGSTQGGFQILQQASDSSPANTPLAIDSSGNLVATSVTITGKYNAKNISGTGQAGLFSELSDSVTGGSDPLRILCPSDDTDKDFFILMGDDPYSMAFSSGIPTSANKGLLFTGTGSIYMGSTGDRFAPLADNSNDLGASNYRWDDIYATNGTIQTSDANDKTNIENTDLGLNFVSQLTPRKYKYIDGKSDRTHYGLIAQEVKSVLDNNNINTSDFAAYIEGEVTDTSNQGTGEYKLGLRYSEFISILIKSIQQLEERIKQLEN